MKKYFVTYATDEISKYNTRFSVGALAAALWDNGRQGNPMCISHDLLRPIGWNRPAALHIEPGLARLVGFSLLAETNSEYSNIHSAMEEYLNERLFAEQKDDLDTLRILLKPYIDGREQQAILECAALCRPGLAVSVFPSLFADQDKDGLVAIGRLSPIGPGVYRTGEFLLFAHPFFRRSLSRLNNLNFPFLERLQAIRDPEVTVRVALDPDLVGLAASYKLVPMEFEYWRGPMFNDSLPAIKAGVAHYEADRTQRLYHQISATQFWWHTEDGVHTLEAEELRDAPTERNGDVSYGCRYVHARVDDTGVVNHFDGAIRGYTDEHMIDRLGVDIMHAGRHSVYTKLWRIDGKVPNSLWKALFTDYYRDNPLVGEYLSGKQDDDIAGTDATSIDNSENQSAISEGWNRERLIPFLIAPGDGVRLAISIHPRREQEGNATRTVLAEDIIRLDDEMVPVVSDEILELKKALERIGETVELPRNLRWLLCEDLHIDLPTVVHASVGLPNSLKQTLDAIHTLVAAWNKQGYNRVIAFRVSFPVDDRDVVLSVLGNMTDMEHWLVNSLSRPPTDRDAFQKWLDKVADYLRKAFQSAEDRPALMGTLTSTGELGLQRQPIREFPYQLIWSDTENALMIEAEVPKDKIYLFEAMQTGVLQAATAHIVEELRCRKCGGLYVTCGCSRVLDTDGSVEVARLRESFLFWTDKKA